MAEIPDRNSNQGLDRRVLIVGAGCFGISTAYHLLKRGFSNVTVLDRAPELPAKDAASTDLNKIVRSSYPELVYSRLAREAINSWKTDHDIWGDTYHESGVLNLRSDSTEHKYLDKSYLNDISVGARIQELANGEALRSIFPSDVRTAFTDVASGYLNLDGGWAFAAQGITRLTDRVISMGGQVSPGKSATKLFQEGGETTGVECKDGSVYPADLVILAVGAWTASAFPGLGLGQNCVATGQSVVTIQLTAEETAKYQNCPVVLDMKTGFYIFPPNKDNTVKLAIHGGGYMHTYSDSSPSCPRTFLSHGEEGLLVPKAMVQTMRSYLKEIYPELAEKPFSTTRLCWYTDTPDDDWIIDFYPGSHSLVLATGGSGHAYKFLPNVGRLVVDTITGELDPAMRQRFAIDRNYKRSDIDRSLWSARNVLDVAQLCTPQDLLPLP